MVSLEAFWDTSQKAKPEVIRDTVASTRGSFSVSLFKVLTGYKDALN